LNGVAAFDSVLFARFPLCVQAHIVVSLFFGRNASVDYAVGCPGNRAAGGFDEVLKEGVSHMLEI
jgi:hypothetical protein